MKKINILISTLFLIQSATVFAQSQDIDDAIKDAQQAEAALSGIQSTRSTTQPATNSSTDDTIQNTSTSTSKQSGVAPAPSPNVSKPKSQTKLTKEETAFFRSQLKSLKDRPDLVDQMNSMSGASQQQRKSNPIYVPNMNSPEAEKDKSYVIERDSSKIITKKLSDTDALNLYVCFSAGVSITLDSSISTTLQRVLIDDKLFFDAINHENDRGVYVRLKEAISEGLYYESAIRLVRRSDDKTYLVNLFGLPCPVGVPNPFPKVVYIKDKVAAGDALGINNTLLTPEDLIIETSKGLPRISKNRIRVYDMVTTSGSQWATFGIEIQFPNLQSDQIAPQFVVLDNLQFNKIKSKATYLKIPSEKASASRGGIATARFKITVNIDKDYMQNNKFIYLMYIDQQTKHYQYIKVNTNEYFMSLKKRGFNI